MMVIHASRYIDRGMHMQPVEVDEEPPDTVKRLVVVNRGDWEEFQRQWGKGRVSARIRELVREDIERE